MTLHTASPLEVVCLCEGEWRMCDSRIPASDSRRLISYVEKLGDDYEVLWLPTLSVQHMASFEEAVEAADAYCASHPEHAVHAVAGSR